MRDSNCIYTHSGAQVRITVKVGGQTFAEDLQEEAATAVQDLDVKAADEFLASNSGVTRPDGQY
jgi:hypothetical protein